MRLIVRKERPHPHPGSQLRLTDRDGLRLTAFVTNTAVGSLKTLELRHRRRARCEDRIRTVEDTGLTNLPLHSFAQNEIWLAIVALGSELTTWMQMLVLTSSDARRWEPKRLRLDDCFRLSGASPALPGKRACAYRSGLPGPGLITWALARLEAFAGADLNRLIPIGGVGAERNVTPEKWNPAVSRLHTGRPVMPKCVSRCCWSDR